MDPDHHLSDQTLQVFDLSQNVYRPQPPAAFQTTPVGLTLRLWQGLYEDTTATWLRWADAEGRIIPTGKELSKREAARADLMAAKLRELGIDPDSVA